MQSKRLLWGLVALATVAAILGVFVGQATRRAQPEEQPAVSASSVEPADRPLVVDVHVHLSPGGADRLLDLMKRWKFDHVVNLSGGHPLLGLEDQLAAAARTKGRVTVFTTLAYEQAERPGYGPRMAKAVEIAHRMGAKGLKISKALGLGLKGPKGNLLPVDDPELDVVFETAGRLEMPVAIHAGDPKAFWDPVDEKNERYAELSANPGWALAGEDVPTFHQILDQLERRVARHPKTKFISVHFGNDAEEPERVARMLREYPNLYIDTAARIPEMGRHDAQKMRDFFVEFQDRILYGSDLGVGSEGTPLFLGSSGEDDPGEKEEVLFFSASRRYFETGDRQFAHPTPIQGDWKIDGIALPANILAKVYATNAIELLGIEATPTR